MRRIITILALLGNIAQAQYTKHIIPTSAEDMAVGVHIPPANPNGRKHPVFIYLHGIDLRGPVADITTPNGVDRVATKGIPSYITTAPMPYFTKPGTSEQYRWAVFFPQCPTTRGVWVASQGIAVIDFIKSSYANVVDTNMIVIIGFSLGGFGVFDFLRNSYIRNNVSWAVTISAGGNGTTDWQIQADENPPVDVYHNANDKLALIARSDNPVLNLNQRNPVCPVQYKRIASTIGGVNYHDIWVQVETRTKGASYLLTNGDTWTINELIYERGLRFTKHRYKR